VCGYLPAAWHTSIIGRRSLPFRSCLAAESSFKSNWKLYTALPAYTCPQTVQNDAEPLPGFGFSAPWRKSSTNDERRPKPPCRFCDSDTVTQQVSRLLITYLHGLLGSRVVSVLDSGAERPGFKPQPRRCRVTVLGKLFTSVVPLFNSSEIFSSPFKVCDGNCGPGGK